MMGVGERENPFIKSYGNAEEPDLSLIAKL